MKRYIGSRKSKGVKKQPLEKISWVVLFILRSPVIKKWYLNGAALPKETD
jgi:hypothetical protein